MEIGWRMRIEIPMGKWPSLAKSSATSVSITRQCELPMANDNSSSVELTFPSHVIRFLERHSSSLHSIRTRRRTSVLTTNFTYSINSDECTCIWIFQLAQSCQSAGPLQRIVQFLCTFPFSSNAAGNGDQNNCASQPNWLQRQCYEIRKRRPCLKIFTFLIAQHLRSEFWFERTSKPWDVCMLIDEVRHELFGRSLPFTGGAC